MKTKVAIGIPQPELTSHWFQESLQRLILSNFSDIDLCHFSAVGSVIASNRNRLVQMAKNAKATHLLQIDADSVFPAHALKILLAHDKDIVGATTCSRSATDRRPMCEPLERSKVTSDNAVIPVKLIGMNFMLIKMTVFDKLKPPYYADPPRWMMNRTWPDIELPELVAEDEYFCLNAQDAGFQVFCDMNLSMGMGHIGSVIHYIK